MCAWAGTGVPDGRAAGRADEFPCEDQCSPTPGCAGSRCFCVECAASRPQSLHLSLGGLRCVCPCSSHRQQRASIAWESPGVCPCSLHSQWRVSIAWGSVRRVSVFASPSTISGESRSLWSLCGRHRAAVLLQKVNKNCAACELKLSRVWRAYAADGMRVCTSLSLCSWQWKL